MTKKTREQVYNKFGGKCAYTGHLLEQGMWQVDHISPKVKYIMRWENDKLNHIDNLVPAITIVNHYKRGLDLEGFRRYMLTFHIRLGKLPKKTMVERTQKRKEYMYKVAGLFGITPDIPFDGKFYFEK